MECAAIGRGLAALMLASAPLAGWAHPHMWIDAEAEVVFDAQGRVSALRQTWLFDEMFGAYATQGLPREADGSLSPGTRQRMAKDWMASLGEPISHYFTRIMRQGATLAFAAPRDSDVGWDGKRLSLSFTLPLAQPVAPGPEGLTIDVFDPTYFVAYAFDAPQAWRLRDAPANCRQSYRPPQALDWKTLQQLAAIPSDVDTLPDELFAITKGLTHRNELRCP
ncbi:DUF1007 family protein [Bordetella hinzii]|uniref:DUF1007 domain-containing protein n=3 Tax=Bordetella hinzii TaxID=103855 RepID=A0AAN1VFE3_9BORD|nr:DUF1007 domain-containing protein [Bordetella hinzii]KCB23234.1 PF06226 family protein [Bordetella hinzii OH87 BAL007II]KCB31741.1 PF06226 family protein [Bordetella hinzii CA90 BAL1384]KCB42756.1 PF06226 family protein [Bordetella hinzii 5132]KCB46161.1 PF06226 family protein [Bordetella hinzii 4161]KCB46779.1 PF06226 family protein [Bordetella hinzii 1277]KXA73753.1 hypothetical protein AXA74_07040 [Bordetella hinzii LMG 13501]